MALKGFLANPRGKILGKPIDSMPRESWALPSNRLQSNTTTAVDSRVRTVHAMLVADDAS